MLNGPWLKAQATFYTRSSFSNYSKSREMEKEEWEKRSWMQKLLFSQWGKWGKACAQVKSEHEIFKNHLMQVTARHRGKLDDETQGGGKPVLAF